jgi:hypothetical protein
MYMQMYKESHESGPPFRDWEPPCPTKLLNALVRLLRRTYELPMTDDDRHMQAPLHQVSEQLRHDRECRWVFATQLCKRLTPLSRMGGR